MVQELDSDDTQTSVSYKTLKRLVRRLLGSVSQVLAGAVSESAGSDENEPKST